MNEPAGKRLQKLFLAALEVPDDQRHGWLHEHCGDDTKLLAAVEELLAHDQPSRDPLEQGLHAALGEFPTTLIPDSPATGDSAGNNETEAIVMDSRLFLSKLTEVGVLSPEELEELSATVAQGQSDSDPRKLASQLVSDGKLTEYQASALLNGQPDLLLDKYLILDLVGAGGMGMVFKAIHRTMNRTVAIKMISQHLLSSHEQIKRFQREVRVAATLEHPHIVRAYDADQANGVHFLVLEYVRGETLAQTVRRDGPLSLEAAVDAIMQAARGLGHAHEQGIIHRDVKPANLMRNRRGTVKVLDLGLADVDESFRLVQQSSAAVPGSDPIAYEPSGSDLTQAGALLGTVSYMAPEQSLRANAADARSDTYALGCTLYYLLTGEPPYAGETVFEVFAQHRDGEIPSLRAKRPDVPAAVEAVCKRMLAKSPDDRFQSMEELLAALQACGIVAPEDSAKPSAEYWQSKRAAASAVPTPVRSVRHQSWWRTWAILPFVLIVGAYAMSLLMGPRAHRNRDSQTETVGNSGSTVHDEETRSASEEPNTATTKERDEAEPSAADLLATGEWEWRTVERLPDYINRMSPKGGDMTADGLIVVFLSYSSGNGDLWMATRASRERQWEMPVNLGETINSDEAELFPALSPDGLVLTFNRKSMGQSSETMISQRRSRDASWSAPVLCPVNSNAPPKLGADKAVDVVVKQHNANGENWSWDLFEVERLGPGPSWGPPRRLPSSINTSLSEGSATISEDGRLLIFHRWNPNEEYQRLFYCVRPSPDGSWSPPEWIQSLQNPDASTRAKMINAREIVYSEFVGDGKYNLCLARLVRRDVWRTDTPP